MRGLQSATSIGELIIDRSNSTQTAIFTGLKHGTFVSLMRLGRFVARNWLILAWCAFYAAIIWYIVEYQAASIIAGWR